MPLKFIGGDGWGEDFAAAAALVYAVDQGATVINCSWGGGDSKLIKDAVDYAASKGVILSVSAGNEYSDNDGSEWASYPASYDSTNVISVAASDRKDGLAAFSNYGEDSVDLAAPGVDVTSTMPAEQAGFYTDARSFKSVYLPVQAEVLEPASARNALIAGAVSQLGEAPDAPILVVDDSAAKVTKETQGVRLGVYTQALAAAGFPNVTTWVTDSKGTPSPAAMEGKTVVWFTGKDTMGWYNDFCLNIEEQRAIAAYLDAGGRFVLVSGKAATDLQAFGGKAAEFDLITDYFGARWLGIEHWGRTFEGRSTSRLAGTRVTIPEAYANPESGGNLWPTASDAVSRVETGFPPTSIMYTGQYTPLSGTSMAAPHVSGAIALLKAKYPSSSPDELVARIINTVDRKPAFAGKTASGGRLNVAAAMSSYPGRVSITSPKKGDRLHAGSGSTLRWTPAVGGAVGATYTAQVGMPYTAFENGFENGTLGTFTEPTVSGSPWSVSAEATAVHSGWYGAKSGTLPPSRPAPDLGEGWYYAGMSAMQTTITVPEGGGDLSFNWRMPAGDGWDTIGWLAVDEYGGAILDPWALEDPKTWTKATYHLTAGEHSIMLAAANYTMVASDVRLYVDDITLTAHKFTNLGVSGAGATSINFPVPSTATNDAWFRVQSHLNGVDSAWATVKGTRIVTDAVAPPAPSALWLTPDLNGNVGIHWTNPTVADFDHVLVLASSDHTPTSRDESAVVAYEGTGTAVAYGPVADGEHVYVSAWAVDTSGNWSSLRSAEATATDRTAPSPVRSLRVLQPQSGLPMVLWGGGRLSGDTATVLRSYTSTPTVGDADAMELDSDKGSALDWDVDPDATQVFYTVYLTDPSGNTSAPRSIRVALESGGVGGSISVESAQTEPMSGSAMVETTTAWVVADVTNATQMRVSIDGETDPDADWVPFQPRFAVEFTPTHGQHSVNVELRRSSDGAATVLSATALVMLRNPLAPSKLTAESWNTGVKLRWDVRVDPTLASYRVEAGPTTARPVDARCVSLRLRNGGRVAVRRRAIPGAKRYYRAVGIDILGREGEASVLASGTAGVGRAEVHRRRPGGHGRCRFGRAVLVSDCRALRRHGRDRTRLRLHPGSSPPTRSPAGTRRPCWWLARHYRRAPCARSSVWTFTRR